MKLLIATLLVVHATLVHCTNEDLYNAYPQNWTVIPKEFLSDYNSDIYFYGPEDKAYQNNWTRLAQFEQVTGQPVKTPWENPYSWACRQRFPEIPFLGCLPQERDKYGRYIEEERWVQESDFPYCIECEPFQPMKTGYRQVGREICLCNSWYNSSQIECIRHSPLSIQHAWVRQRPFPARCRGHYFPGLFHLDGSWRRELFVRDFDRPLRLVLDWRIDGVKMP